MVGDLGCIVMQQQKPVILITMGDAAGVGPEIIVNTLLTSDIKSICRPVVIGDLKIINKVVGKTGNRVIIKVIPDTGVYTDDSDINVIDLANIDIDRFRPGQASEECGKASMEYINKAVELVTKDRAAAIVTAPINKEAAILAGYSDMGHLEYMAHLSGAKEYATMLVSGTLRVVHLTTHHSLFQACSMVTRERIMSRIVLTNDSFKKWGYPKPVIGVAALNPHGGEGGLLGKEEITEIKPAVDEAREKGIDARGPYPADSIFVRAVKGEFDAVLAMYHDQGHIPVKVHGFEKSVSVALGLPFIRTSVDHGTAYDIAWQGKANYESMVAAVDVAASLCTRKKLSS
jgi:4-hydroxythreonine-4-phosphate dehydrogenase